MSTLLYRDGLPAIYGEHADWFDTHVPFFDCPDEAMRAIYYFRWDVYRQHLRQATTGWVITAFLPENSFAGFSHTVVSAAGHHFYEGRWLRQMAYLDDYTRFWLMTPGVLPQTSSTWLADAIYARALVTGDLSLPLTLLNALVKYDRQWEMGHQDKSGLFWQLDTCDGMAYQISGSGYRPTMNSYQYGNARAISLLAEQAGRSKLARRYQEKAAHLKHLVQTCLWDQDAHFFKTVPTAKALRHQRLHYMGRSLPPIQRVGTLADVRELQGYLPWYFSLPDAGFERAWQYLGDPASFAAPYGPSSAERRHPHWQAAPTEQQPECLWRGSSWPFATSQTLVALANVLRGYTQSYVNKQDYYELLQTYTRSQWLSLKDGVRIPWIDESLHPDTGEWATRAILLKRGVQPCEQGRASNHSTYADHIISGLVGLQPRFDDVLVIDPLLPEQEWEYFCLEQVPYHGHDLTILYDRDGSQYQRGAGLRLFVDGDEVASRTTLGRLEATLSVQKRLAQRKRVISFDQRRAH